VKKLGRRVFICMALMLVPMLTLSVYASAASKPGKSYLIRFATGDMPPIPSATMLQELEKVIPEETDGQVKFKAYLGGQLFSDYDAPAQLQSGALEMCWGGYTMSALSPGWDVIAGCPFLFDDYDHYLRFQKTDAWKTMNANLEAKGIKTIAEASDPAFAEFFNKVRPIQTLADFGGLKIRIPPIPALVALCKSLGIENMTISTPEVVTSLQTGMIDGLMTPIMTLRKFQLSKYAQYVTRANVTFAGGVFVAGAKFWNSLPEDLQKKLQKVFEEYGQKKTKVSAEMIGGFWAQYKAAGGTITDLTKEEKVKWLAAGKGVWDVLKTKSEEAKMVIEAADAIREK
jgi:TRAP-type C4-dicarboxylate transport system substrate-binding protein